MRIHWDAGLEEYPLLPERGETLEHFMDRWFEQAAVNGSVDTDDVFNLVLALQGAYEWLDDQLGEVGGAVLSPEQYERLRQPIIELMSVADALHMEPS